METKTAALQKKRSEIMSTKAVSAVQRCKAAAVKGEINMALQAQFSSTTHRKRKKKTTTVLWFYVQPLKLKLTFTSVHQT